MTAEIDPLGARYRAYRPAVAFLIAGFIFGVLLIVAGAVVGGSSWYGAYMDQFDLPLYTEKGRCWFAVGLSNFLGGALIIFGWQFVMSSYELKSYSVELRRNGFRVCSAGSCEEVQWADVELIKRITRFQRLSLLKGLGGLIASETASTHYKAIAKSGKGYDFNRMSITDIGEFVRILREVALQNSIQWEKAEEHI